MMGSHIVSTIDLAEEKAEREVKNLIVTLPVLWNLNSRIENFQEASLIEALQERCTEFLYVEKWRHK